MNKELSNQIQTLQDKLEIVKMLRILWACGLKGSSLFCPDGWTGSILGTVLRGSNSHSESTTFFRTWNPGVSFLKFLCNIHCAVDGEMSGEVSANLASEKLSHKTVQ